MSSPLVLASGFGFGSLEARLAELGFRRDDSVRPLTPDLIPGEPELAAWRRGDGEERLTYTFNPVVSLRVLAHVAPSADATAQLAGCLPALDAEAIAGLLAEAEPRRVLLGLLAARVLQTRELAASIARLCTHPDRTIRRAAEDTAQALESGSESVARREALRLLHVLCEQAVPALAALVGPQGPAAVESLRPRAEDYARVFRPEIAEAVRAAYEQLWRTPPVLETLESGQLELRVDAAPAGMLLEENELSRRFPGGYRALAPHLLRQPIWFVWRYLAAGESAGVRYDGVVRLDERWVWFPKPYRVVGELLRAPAR